MRTITEEAYFAHEDDRSSDLNLEEILQMTDDLTDGELDDLVAVVMIVSKRHKDTGQRESAVSVLNEWKNNVVVIKK